MEDWRQRIVELLKRQQKIEAIKVYREATGVGLAEAKDFVEGLERSLSTGQLPPAPPVTSAPEDADLVKLLRSGNKLQAIKQYRERYGVGLKEAADAIERLSEQTGIATSNKGCLVVAVLCALSVGSLVTIAIAWH